MLPTKKLFQLTLIAIILIAFYGCRKISTNSNNISPISSQWTFEKITYKGIGTSYDTVGTNPPSSSILKSSDSATDKISVTFWVKPKAGGTFVVNSGNLPQPLPNTCTIVLNHAGDIYFSTGKSGDKVDLAISGGTLTASFTNVTVEVTDTSFATTNVSGILIKK
jgi:hypothetical protein